jgi:putative peptide zinc metalloprotease protein
VVEVDDSRQPPDAALRPELRFFPRVQDGAPELLLEDPITLRFYRVGQREHQFMRLLDGGRSPGEALAAANRELTDPLTEEEAGEIMRFLYREGLLRTRGRLSQQRLQTVKRTRLLGGRLRKLNALFVRIPLVNPDRFLSRVLPYLRVLAGPGALLLFAAIWVGGLYQLLADPSRLAQAAAGVLYPANWTWLALAWLALKLLHELFHGLVSKYYGGQVYEAGVVLVLFMPIGYVDATPSWRFPNRWQRMHTAAAGMIAEMTAAGIAAWIWAALPPGPASDIAFNVILIAAVSTLLFNANPLMRFDGYFILTDLVGIPNLYAKGQQYLGQLGRLYLLGMPGQWSAGAGPGKDLFVKIYGVLALIWRLSVIVVILIAAGELFYGLGIVLAVLGAIALVAVPLWRLGTLMTRGKDGVRPTPRRYLPRLLLAGLGITLVTSHLAWSSSLSVPAVVTFDDREVVRVKTPGFVDEIHVRAGQRVSAGDPLVSLRNPELEADLVTIETAYDEARLKARRLLLAEDLPAYQAQQQELASLSRQRQELGSRHRELVLRARRDGRVLARRLPDMSGTHYPTGTELMSVVDQDRKAMRLSVAAADLPLLALSPGDEIAVSLPGRGEVFHARLEQTAPRATTRVEMAILAASNGGPLPVRPRTSADSASVTRDGGQVEYLEPRVILESQLDAADSLELFAGEIGVAHLPTAPRPLGEHAVRTLRDWLDHLLDRRADTL